MIPESSGRWKIADRIDVGGHRGTIRYIGPVVGTKGDWLGVDWDDSTRGKHNGTHEGVSYFSARYPTSGSFIRPAKVTPPTSCVEAIKMRYGLIEENAGVDLESLAQVQKEMHAKFFEVVGAEKINKKQSQFKSLQVVSLRDEFINEAGPPGALNMLSPNIRELDLSKNLLSSWKAVADIAAQLPHLRLLNLSENRLEINGSIVGAFDKVEHLILAHCGLTWSEILRCCEYLPSLKILQVPFNGIARLSNSDNVLPQVTSIDLEGNPLCVWSEVNKLGSLQNLKTLNVSLCSLQEISFPSKPNESSTELFPALEHLLISENLISEWRSISELDKLASLTDLKCVKNPILDLGDSPTNYQVIIARIQRLKTLNGQIILPEERRGAELDFLKLHGREFLEIKTTDDEVAFYKKYPCYKRLVKDYGPPEASELKAPPQSLKNSLIQLELVSGNNPNKVIKKKVSPYMTVQKMQGLVQRLFDTGFQVPHLYCVHSMADSTEIELSNEMKDLNFYSVEDGCRIVVRW